MLSRASAILTKFSFPESFLDTQSPQGAPRISFLIAHPALFPPSHACALTLTALTFAPSPPIIIATACPSNGTSVQDGQVL